MLETAIVVALVAFTAVFAFLAIRQYLRIIEDAGLDLPWKQRPRRNEQPTWKYSSKTTTKHISCPVPFPECGPDDCPKCGGKRIH